MGADGVVNEIGKKSVVTKKSFETLNIFFVGLYISDDRVRHIGQLLTLDAHCKCYILRFSSDTCQT